MATGEGAPAQYKQPSRKGKKAWRKNVDVTQISTGLEEVREQIIQGGVISEKSADQLFTIDTAGDDVLRNALNKPRKALKADEILAQRSAVPAVSSKKRLSDFSDIKNHKKTRISGKEYDRLRKIAYGGDQVQKDVVETGAAADHDPWAVREVEQKPEFSFLEPKRKKVEPVTLKQPPISLLKSGKSISAVPKPVAGKSYNPLFSEWQDLVRREGEKAIEAEKKRLGEAREEAERLERIMAASESDTDGNESAWESEWEGFSDNEEPAVKSKRPERKTPAQRNKVKRRKAAEGLAKHEARMKAKEQQLQRIKELVKSVAEKEKAQAELQAMNPAPQEESTESEEEGAEVLRKRNLGKHPVPEANLEVVLPDELQDSLRRLKPEGNLLKDRFRSLMIRGKIETRKGIPYGKKRKVTVTEKWSYKDWKLE